MYFHALRKRFLLFSVSVLLFSTFARGFYDSSVETSTVTRNVKDYGANGRGKSDDSSKVQSAVNDVANAGGGKVIIPNGKYKFSEIQLRSNVHIEIAKGVQITPIKGTKAFAVFALGRDVAPIKNVSVRGKGGKFTVKIPKVLGPGRVFFVGKVTNFYLANFHVEDSLSKFSSVIMAPVGEKRSEIDFPRTGTMENASTKGSSYGYGLIQAHAASRVLFRNLKADGGVALRLETGLVKMNDNQIGGVSNIIGQNLEGVNCKAGVLLSPHSMKNGKVEITNVKTKSCGFGVLIGKGFVSKKQKNPNLKPGFFAKGSFVKNIDATYGTKAQLKEKDIKNLPSQLQKLVDRSSPEQPAEGIFRGPAVSAVGLGQDKNVDNVKLMNVKARKFTVQKKAILRLI